MPYSVIDIKEGFYTEDTRSDSPNRWIDGDHMRFVTDVPQKIGGWEQISSQFLGICRSMVSWATPDNSQYMGFGTNLKLYTFYQNQIWDITPYRNAGMLINPFTTTITSNIVNVFQPNNGLVNTDLVMFQNVVPFAGITINGIYSISVVDANNYHITVSTSATSSTTGGGNIVGYAWWKTLTNPFSTVLGSNIVKVTQTNHGCQPNDFIYFMNSAVVGGLTLNGAWEIVEVIDANNYTFTANANATSTVNLAGGTVNYLYEVNTGAVDVATGYGYGASTYGTIAYGTAAPNMGVIYDFPRIWSLDIWQDGLIASPRDGGIYYWPYQEDSINTRATMIPNAPAQSKVVAVWPDSPFLIAFGCTNTLGNYDPLTIRWCNEGDFTEWISNSAEGILANQVLLTSGNYIMGIAKMRGQILIATDTTLYSMYTNGQISVFDFRSVANVKVLSPNAMVEANGVVYIMGDGQFYIYDGTLKVLKCEVRRHVFENLDYSQAFKIYGSINSAFNEIWWFYPVSEEDDNYVVYNYQKDIWYFGTMDRTAFLDIGAGNGTPQAAGSDGYLYAQEYGFDANNEPMYAFLESGSMTISSKNSGGVSVDSRNNFMYVKNLIPDLLETNTAVTLTASTRRFPDSPPVVYGPYTINPGSPAVLDDNGNIIVPAVYATDVIGTRIKGGQFSFKWEMNAKGAIFEVGSLKLLYLPTGTK